MTWETEAMVVAVAATTVAAWVMNGRRPQLNRPPFSPGRRSSAPGVADARGRVCLLSPEQTRGGAGAGHPVDSTATAGTRLLHRDRGTSSSRRAIIIDAPVASPVRSREYRRQAFPGQRGSRDQPAAQMPVCSGWRQGSPKPGLAPDTRTIL